METGIVNLLLKLLNVILTIPVSLMLICIIGSFNFITIHELLAGLLLCSLVI